MRPIPRPHEDGAIAVTAGVSLLLVLAVLALVVDVGRLTYTDRDQQGATDRAALDGVLALGDRYDPALDPRVAADTLARESLSVNTGAEQRISSLRDTMVEVGWFDPTTDTFTSWQPGDVEQPSAVRVTTVSDVGYLFLPGTATVTREAIAGLESLATLSVGSMVANVSSGDALLLDALFSGLLGSSVSLSAVGYQGLVDASVDVAAVLANLGITAGSPSTVLASDVALSDLLSATATALNDQGDPSSVAAASSLGVLVATGVDPNLDVRLDDLFHLTTTDVGQAAGASLDVYELLVGAAQVANGQQLLTLPLTIAIPGVTSAQVRLVVVEGPRFAIGPPRFDTTTAQWTTVARTSQVRLAIDLQMDDLVTITGLRPLDVQLPLVVDVAAAEAALTAVVCRDPIELSSATVATTTSGARALIGATTSAQLTGSAPLPTPPAWTEILEAHLTLLGTKVLEVDARASTSVGGGSREEVFTGPFPVTTSGGATSLSLGGLLGPPLETQARVLGALPVSVSTVVSALTAALGPVLTAVDTAVVQPILTGLRVDLAGADTTVHDVDCDGRILLR